MKKAMRILVGIIALALLVLSWVFNFYGRRPPAQPAEETPVPAAAETAEPTPEPTEEPEPTPVPVPADFNPAGEWVIDLDRSEYEQLLEICGSSFRDYGSLMRIDLASGTLSVYTGANGGEGTYSYENGILKASLKDINDPERTYESVFEAVVLDGEVFLTEQMDGTTVVWTRN